MSPTSDLLQAWETAVIDSLQTAKWVYNDSTQTNIVSAFVWTCSKLWETVTDKQWVIEDKMMSSQRLVTKCPLTWHNRSNIIINIDLVLYVHMGNKCIQTLLSWLSCKTWFLISICYFARQYLCICCYLNYYSNITISFSLHQVTNNQTNNQEHWWNKMLV